ncbi:MAG: hypothetical protein FPO08_00420 [Geobacter sp.]|nr:MAG: hypothetical protein FPO08_00420 [Geobacter sp.]
MHIINIGFSQHICCQIYLLESGKKNDFRHSPTHPNKTIFLNPENLDKPIYVRATNTSDFQEIDLTQLIKDKITAAGRNVTSNPKDAAYQLQANLLFLGEEKKGMTMEGAVAGGVGGALAGAMLANNRSMNGYGGSMTALAVGAAGAGLGALAGSMVHVDTYSGVVDISIKEVVDGGVTGTETADVKNGSGAGKVTTRAINETRQEYRTRIGVKAVQTNIDRTEATKSITERLASQIAGYFK